MTKPDTITISKEVFEALKESGGYMDDSEPTNRKARRAAESERRRYLRRPSS